MTRLEQDGLDWVTVGYFDNGPSPERLPDPQRDPWGYLRAAFRAASSGDRRLLPPLLDIFVHTDNSLLAVSCAELIGDSGPNELVNHMAKLLERDLRIDRALLCCTALHNRSRIDDAETLLRTYLRYADHPDADIIPVWLADIIEPREEDEGISEPKVFDEIKDYEQLVSRCISRLSTITANDDLVIRWAKPFDIIALTHVMLNDIRTTYFRPDLRHRFEAVTGIDCSSFYRKGQLRPLAAAAILEEFLESPAAQRFEPGRRYFFGHEIF